MKYLLDFEELHDVNIEGLYRGYMIRARINDSELNLTYNKYFLSKDKFKTYLKRNKVNYKNGGK